MNASAIGLGVFTSPSLFFRVYLETKAFFFLGRKSLPLLRQARRLLPFVERIIGDAGYQGKKMAAAFVRMAKIHIILRRLAATPSA